MTATELLNRAGMKDAHLAPRDLERWMASQGLATVRDGGSSPPPGRSGSSTRCTSSAVVTGCDAQPGSASPAAFTRSLAWMHSAKSTIFCAVAGLLAGAAARVTQSVPRAGGLTTRDECVTLRSMRSLAATLVLCSLVLVTAGWAGAAPPPPPAKFWSVSRCERVLQAHDYALPTADGHRFHVGQRVCVGTGGPHTCEWTSDHASPLLGVHRVYALSLHRRHRSLVDARNTRRPRHRRHRASRRGPVRRVATRLLHVPSERQPARNQRSSGTLPLNRRPDGGSSHATGERDRLRGRVADAPEAARAVGDKDNSVVTEATSRRDAARLRE